MAYLCHRRKCALDLPVVNVNVGYSPNLIPLYTHNSAVNHFARMRSLYSVGNYMGPILP